MNWLKGTDKRPTLFVHSVTPQDEPHLEWTGSQCDHGYASMN